VISPDQPITYGGGNSAVRNDPDPGIISTLPTNVVSGGTNPVVISVAPKPNYAHVSGLEITSSLPSGLMVDFQDGNGDTQSGFEPFAFPGTDPNPSGAQRMWYFSEIGRGGSASVTVPRQSALKRRYFAAIGSSSQRRAKANIPREQGEQFGVTVREIPPRGSRNLPSPRTPTPPPFPGSRPLAVPAASVLSRCRRRKPPPTPWFFLA